MRIWWHWMSPSLGPGCPPSPPRQRRSLELLQLLEEKGECSMSPCPCVTVSLCPPIALQSQPLALSPSVVAFSSGLGPIPVPRSPSPSLSPSTSLSPHAMAMVSPVSPCVSVASLTSPHIPEVSLVSPCVSLSHIHGVTHMSPCTPMCPRGVTDVPTTCGIAHVSQRL